jgi:hypothetical protein
MKNLVVAACLLSSVCGCGGPKPVAPHAASTIAPTDLYPLRPGNAWSYDVDTGDPTNTLAITRVESVEGSLATVRTGSERIEYDVRDEGIYVVADDGWLVRAPIEEGSRWPARGGRTAELVSLHASIDTPAGFFDGCVEVIETGGRLELEVRTVYCPLVGPVAVDSTMRSTVSKRSVSVHARLRGYDVDGGEALTR